MFILDIKLCKLRTYSGDNNINIENKETKKQITPIKKLNRDEEDKKDAHSLSFIIFKKTKK